MTERLTRQLVNIANICKTGKYKELSHEVWPGDCIALLILDREGRILLVKENQTNKKHGREKTGLWSIPTETCEEGDHHFLDSVYAAITEEISGTKDFQFISGSYRCDLLPLRNEKNLFYVRHGGALFYSGNSGTNHFSPLDCTEITDYKWVTAYEFDNMSKLGEVEPDVMPFVGQMFSHSKEQGFLEPISNF